MKRIVVLLVAVSVITLSLLCSCVQSECQHIFGEWEITSKATYQSTGEKSHSCNICGYVETEIIEKEISPFAKLKNYLLENGVYDNGSYIVVFDKSDSKSYGAIYSLSDDEISFVMNMEIVTFVMNLSDNSSSGVWTLIDSEDGYNMAGAFNGSNKTFTCLKNSFPSYLKNEAEELAKSMFDDIHSNYDNYLAKVGITLADLGFKG